MLAQSISADQSLAVPSEMRSENFAHIPEGDRKCRGIGSVCNHRGELPGRALALPLRPLGHHDEIGRIVQIHADGQAAVIARPMARENFDAPAAAPDDPDQTGRLRGVHQVADMGPGNA